MARSYQYLPYSNKIIKQIILFYDAGCNFLFIICCFIFLSGKQLTGDEAPLARDLNAWLESHPGWEQVEDSSDDDDQSDSEGGEDNDDEKHGSSGLFIFFLTYLHVFFENLWMQYSLKLCSALSQCG